MISIFPLYKHDIMQIEYTNLNMIKIKIINCLGLRFKKKKENPKRINFSVTWVKGL